MDSYYALREFMEPEAKYVELPGCAGHKGDWTLFLDNPERERFKGLRPAVLEVAALAQEKGIDPQPVLRLLNPTENPLATVRGAMIVLDLLKVKADTKKDTKKDSKKSSRPLTPRAAACAVAFKKASKSDSNLKLKPFVVGWVKPNDSVEGIYKSLIDNPAA